MINYYLLTKPGIVVGNLITVAAGFLLASHGPIDVWLFFATLLGLSLVMASACVFNNYIDRPLDKKMKRTQNRALVTGLITPRNALIFATLVGLLGQSVLCFYTNLLTAIIAGIGFFVYVVLYSLWKGRTIYGTAIGSIAGGVPPVVGYCAVSNQFDLGAAILFAIMVLWQMPHFFSIAMYRFEDYAAAAIPVLPIKQGIPKTKRRMVLYIIGFTLATLLLTLFHYTGYIYLVSAAILGSAWLLLCLKGFKSVNDQVWARHMFRLSLVVITILSLVIPFDTVRL
ncbi:heme o synthase [Chlamydiota bacterium]